MTYEFVTSEGILSRARILGVPQIMRDQGMVSVDSVFFRFVKHLVPPYILWILGRSKEVSGFEKRAKTVKN